VARGLEYKLLHVLTQGLGKAFIVSDSEAKPT
jgi:hypothetical protein